MRSSGSKWRTRRKMLTPAFHFRILEDFLPIMNEQGEIFAGALRGNTHTVFDITKFVTACTLDIICETAMGVKVNAQTNPSSAYVSNIYRVGSNFINRAVRPWLWLDLLYQLTPQGRLYHHDIQAIHRFTKKTLRNKKKHIYGKAKRTDHVQDWNTHSQLSNEYAKNIKRAKEKFLSSDMPSILCSNPTRFWQLLSPKHHSQSLSLTDNNKHPIIESESATALNDFFSSVFTDEGLGEVPSPLSFKNVLTDFFFQETLRLFPSVPIIGREVHKEFCVNGNVVPQGAIVVVFSYMLHRDPESFPKPEEFFPERFLPENSLGRHPFAYVPFSAGPRNCIGQRFALMEEKIVLSNLFRRFSVKSLVPRHSLKLAGELVLRNQDGIPVELTPRQPSVPATKEGP
ncbi:unnamed protein product [Ixodes hexagonus]